MPEFRQNGITAHRGNSGDFPENTIPAFREGIACGADWLELDVHQTADGHLVVCHDATTGQTADQAVVIGNSTWAQLRELDMSCGFRRMHGATVDACPATGMPLLREVLELAMAQSKTRVSIQPKADCVPAIVALVRELRAGPWIGFNDGNVQTLIQARKLLPEAWVFLDTGPGGPSIETHIRTALACGFQAIVMHHSTVTAKAAESVRAAGLEPGSWTINEPNLMWQLLNVGIKRMYTDYPLRLKQLLS